MKGVQCMEGAGNGHKVQRVEAAGSSEQSGQGKEAAGMRRVRWREAVGTRRGLGLLVWLEAAGSRYVMQCLEAAGMGRRVQCLEAPGNGLQVQVVEAAGSS